jgi:ubiquitin-protein ligase
MAQRRLQKELQDLQKEESSNSLFVRDIIVNDTNLFEWKFTILPASVPYNVASFVIEMKFPRK